MCKNFCKYKYLCFPELYRHNALKILIWCMVSRILRFCIILFQVCSTLRSQIWGYDKKILMFSKFWNGKKFINLVIDTFNLKNKQTFFSKKGAYSFCNYVCNYFWCPFVLRSNSDECILHEKMNVFMLYNQPQNKQYKMGQNLFSVQAAKMPGMNFLWVKLDFAHLRTHA